MLAHLDDQREVSLVLYSSAKQRAKLLKTAKKQARPPDQFALKRELWETSR